MVPWSNSSVSTTFQSMLPVRGATRWTWTPYFLANPNFNPCSPCGERHHDIVVVGVLGDFNPCSPCGERPGALVLIGQSVEFQSMLPVRGATRPPAVMPTTPPNFNPCSPCGERPILYGDYSGLSVFQSMLPVRGATLFGAGFTWPEMEFQSMLPVRGATMVFCAGATGRIYFNPCSPCGERPGQEAGPGPSNDFNPCSPCGERRPSNIARTISVLFQSMLPVRGATLP